MEQQQRLQLEVKELRQMGVSNSIDIFPRMITPAQDDLLDAVGHLDVDKLIESLHWAHAIAKSAASGGATPGTNRKLGKLSSLIPWLQDIADERLK